MALWAPLVLWVSVLWVPLLWAPLLWVSVLWAPLVLWGCGAAVVELGPIGVGAVGSG